MELWNKGRWWDIRFKWFSRRMWEKDWTHSRHDKGNKYRSWPTTVRLPFCFGVYLVWLLVGLAVQAAYPPALQQLVVSWVGLHLLPLECGAVAGFQTGFVCRRLVLRWSSDGPHGFHILVGLELRSGCSGKSTCAFSVSDHFMGQKDRKTR